MAVPVADEVVPRLRRFARFEDPSAGVAEEQVFVPTEGRPLFATLVTPLDALRGITFLVCHSFAYEQLDLFPLELAFARLAAASGFATMYFQARGYADSGGEFRDATPATHCRDALTAATWLRGRTGIEEVVPVGSRWGAGTALLAARELDSPGVVLWNPAVEPGRYLEDLLKVFSRSRIAGKARNDGEPVGPDREQLDAALASGDDVDLFGYPLSPECYREAHATHPIETLQRAPAHTLVMAVNPRAHPEADVVAERLRALGADARVEQAEGPGAAQFGLGASPAGKRVVTNQPLYRDVARRTVRWALETWPGAVDGSAAARVSPVTEAEEEPAGFQEVPVYVRNGTGWLGAVVTVPEDTGSSVGVVLLASRARDRAHRNGLWVKTAEMIAAEGSYVLRLDYPGVGNSTGEPQLFGVDDAPSGAVADACRFLLEHTPVRHLLLAGTCYGGRVVLEAALQVPEVTNVALVAAPVSRPLSAEGRLRLKAARVLHLGGGRDAGDEPAARWSGPHGRGIALDGTFVDTLRRFIDRGRVYLLYGDRDVVPDDLRRALEGLRLPPGRSEVELVHGEIDSLRSTAMQALVRDKVAAWSRRSAELLREQG
jgi:pimeloyl-ACP methyl ester carboxylesterase